MSNSLWHHGLQHARLPYPTLSPGLCSNHVHWVSDAIQPVHPLSPSSPLALNLSQLQGPSSEYSGLISFRIRLVWSCSAEDSQEPSPTPLFKSINSLALSLLYGPTLTSVMTTGKTVTFTIQTFVGKVMSLLFNTLSRFAIVFLPGSMHLLISWLQSPSSGFRAQENKICHCFYFSSSICHEMMGPAAMMLVFWMLNFKPALSLSSFILIRRLILTDNSVPATCEPNQS